MTRRALPLLLPLIALACKGGPGTDKDNGEVTTDGADGTDGSDGSDGGNASPALLELSLSSPLAEPGSPLTATVVVTDSAGGVVSSPYTLSVSPADGVTISGDTLTFATEGNYYVTATLDENTGISDVEGPVAIDANPPLLLLDSPDRGALATSAAFTLSGTVTDPYAGLDTLTLDGDPVAVDASGHFDASLTLAPGANTPQLVATDKLGHAADLSLGTLWGEFVDPASVVTRALLLQLNDAALDTLGSTATSLLDEATLEDALLASNPLVNTSISCYTLKVYATSLTIGSTSLDLDPEPNQLLLTALINDLAIGLDSRLYLCSSSATHYPGEITVGTTEIDAALSFDVPAVGDVNTTVDSVDVTTTDVNTDLGALTSVLSTFGISLSTLGIDVGGLIEDAVASAVTDALPGVFSDTLSAIAFAESFDLLGATADLDAGVSAVELDADAMTLALDATITAPTSPDAPAIAGALLRSGDEPAYVATPDTHIDLSANLMNRLLHGAWAAGVINQSLSAEELGVDPALIALLFPGAATLNLDITAALPPVVGENIGAGVFRFTLPELHVVATGEVDGVEQELADAWLQVDGVVQAAVDAGQITITIEDLTFAADVLTSDPSGTAAAEDLEEKLSTLAALLLTDLFPAIPLSLPGLGPVTFTGASVDPGGSPALWAVVSGTLTAG